MSFFELSESSAPEDFEAWIDLKNLAVFTLAGNHDEDWQPDDPAAHFQSNEFREYRVFGLGPANRPDGVAEMSLPLKDNRSLSFINIVIRPGIRVGAKLLTEALSRVIAAGRSQVQTFANSRDEILLKLLQESGFAEVQRATISVLSTADINEELWSEAEIASRDYELIQWRNRCPEELVEPFAALCGLMSTDAPQGGAVAEKQVWDAARVRHGEAARAQQGLDSQLSVARHRDTGGLAGYTALEWNPKRPVVGMQGDTLVAAVHRGHRLGLWLKLENLRAAGQYWPELQRVYTGNAEENQPMLRINRALGFAPDKTFITYRKEL
ncbi:hypothetical protein [Psychromicrobium sp. YIM B11713]|uniref:hypothetical protein n=1 Tax=Psychromicrobium sp. YIM B11713 TaxID=3145233 RepID=UPI00374F6E5E